MSVSPYKRLSILMAAYNEEESLRLSVEAVLAAPLPDGLERELIIVNDGSTDGTWEVMRELQAENLEKIQIFSQPRNMGKGAAIRRAITEMTGDLAIFHDSDL
jgi:glycosyltransferase involved in cell wall biosynthesis